MAAQSLRISLKSLPGEADPSFLSPRSPELNGRVEKANRTHREKFYEVYEVDLNFEEHNRQLEQWTYTYNYIRPHQALDYLTPYEYYC